MKAESPRRGFRDARQNVEPDGTPAGNAPLHERCRLGHSTGGDKHLHARLSIDPLPEDYSDATPYWIERWMRGRR